MEAFDAEAAGTAELDPEARAAKLADPFSRLEHVDEDKQRARETHQQISALRQEAEEKHRRACSESTGGGRDVACPGRGEAALAGTCNDRERCC